MLINKVEAVAVSVPLGIVTSMSSRTVHAREYVIVTIEADDGSIGTGYTYAGTTGGRAVRDIVLHSLVPVLRGRPVHDIEGAWKDMYQEALLIGRRGAVLRSMSAIDIALFDLVSRKAGLPLAKFLGGWKDKVPAYASGGYYREGDPFEQLEREIRGNQALGFKDHKIKVGGRSVQEDAARVRHARELVGPEGRLSLDANNAYRNAAEAIEAGRAFERAAGTLGLWWFEEPLSPEDIPGHARVASVLETPVATGEIHQTRWDFRALMESGSAAIIQADAAVVGGISEWRRIAALCASFDIPMAPHWHHNLHVHLAACTPNCVVVEHFDLAKDVFNFERLLTPSSRATPQDGFLEVPTAPGLGIEFDPQAIDRYRIV